MTKKPILCLDFDGVLHAYTSGWQGAHVIPDKPVAGAMDFILRAQERFTIAIYSARSKSIRGRWAMQGWMQRHLAEHWWNAVYLKNAASIDKTWTNHDCWDAAYDWADDILADIKWPWFKPSAFLTIDDRALTFNGDWSSYDPAVMATFRPWNKPRPAFAVGPGSLSDAELTELRNTRPEGAVSYIDMKPVKIDHKGTVK